MNFFEYHDPKEEVSNEHIFSAVTELIQLGYKVLPCENKVPTSKVKRVSLFRTKPLHKENFEFYFTDVQQVAILTGENSLEVIDIDSKYDLTKKLYNQLIYAIEIAMPDVWEKLVVQKSKNGGYHLFYKCGQIGSNKLLASRPSTPEEQQKGERKKTLLETRGQGGYIMVCPSKGYEFIKGNPHEIQFITPEERQMLFSICLSFDKYNKITLKDISHKTASREDAPWNVYNKTYDYGETLKLLVNAGWEIHREDDDRIFLMRPNHQNFKIDGVIWKENSILYIFSTSTAFEPEKPYNAFGVFCQLQYDGSVKAAALALAEKGIGKFAESESEFYETNDKGFLSIRHNKIREWLTDIGIRRFYLNTKEFELVHVVNNIVIPIDHNKLKSLFVDHLSDSNVPEQALNLFLKNIASLFSPAGQVNVVPILENNFVKSTRTQSYLFFRNTAVLVTDTDVKTIDYAKVGGYVWEKNIIPRDFTITETSCVASAYIINVSGHKDSIEGMFRSAIGYMLHSYKDPSNPRVVILTDEYFEQDKDTEPEGGTGKGMFIQLLSKFKNVCTIDGKLFDFNKNFVYQRISHDTQIVAFEDVKRGFDFEKLFSVITEGWTVEKKGQSEFTIPFSDSPKIIITSNYAVKGTSASHARRRYEVEVHPFYSNSKSIRDVHGHLFFDDWNEIEFAKFDNFMIECLQIYLKSGFSEQTVVNMSQKRLVEETSKDFVRFMDDLKKDSAIPTEKQFKSDWLKKFTDMFPDYAKLSQSKYTKWLNKWCDQNGYTLDASNKYNGLYCYLFSEKPFDIF